MWKVWFQDYRQRCGGELMWGFQAEILLKTTFTTLTVVDLENITAMIFVLWLLMVDQFFLNVKKGNTQ